MSIPVPNVSAEKASRYVQVATLFDCDNASCRVEQFSGYRFCPSCDTLGHARTDADDDVLLERLGEFVGALEDIAASECLNHGIAKDCLADAPDEWCNRCVALQALAPSKSGVSA